MSRSYEDEVSTNTKRKALARQDFLCGSCGSLILPFGAKKLVSVAWGESAHAHHRKPVRMGGGVTLANCVILCESCHYSAHEGGRYSKGTVWGRITDFEYFYGKSK